MKTLDFKTYDEKLKIEQITLSDLDNVQDKVLKHKDIVQLRNNDCYLVLFRDVFDLFPEFHPFSSDKNYILSDTFNGILLQRTKYTMFFLYDSDLRCINENFWITDIWHMNDDWELPKFEKLYSWNLRNIAETNCVEHVKIEGNLQDTNEKLEIKPLTISELDELGETEYSKEKLKTFDIVYIHGNLYMTFLSKDIDKYFYKSDFLDREAVKKEGIFFWCDGSIKTDYHVLYLTTYNNKLQYSTDFNPVYEPWDIKKVYVSPINFKLNRDREELNQIILTYYIKKYNFHEIKL